MGRAPLHLPAAQRKQGHSVWVDPPFSRLELEAPTSCMLTWVSKRALRPRAGSASTPACCLTEPGSRLVSCAASLTTLAHGAWPTACVRALPMCVHISGPWPMHAFVCVCRRPVQGRERGAAGGRHDPHAQGAPAPANAHVSSQVYKSQGSPPALW